MAQGPLPNHCLQIPIDHRLHSLLRPDLPTPDPDTGRGKHATTLEQYGKDLRSAGENISLPEIQFAKSLALPETKGGVLILLLQPAPNQRYDGLDFNTIVQECETLRAVDNVLRVVIGSSLKETSCFDAFPFQKVPMRSRSSTGYFEYDEAYDVCKEMIHQKQPDVVVCCYQSQDTTKFDLLYSFGVGKTRNDRVRLGDRFCIPVNAFHPSYAVNYNKSESCFRNLYMLEALRAFHEVSGTWTEREWMMQLRSFCTERAKNLAREKDKQDFERSEASFRDGLEGLKSYFEFLCSDDAARLSDRELYNRVIGDKISQLACDCLLVMTFIVENSKADSPSSQARDARSLARSVRQLVPDFLTDTLRGPLNTVRREVGFVESSAVERLSHSFKFPRAKFGLQYRLKASLQNAMENLNNSFVCGGSNFDSPDLLEKAFLSFANTLEQTLARHLATTTRIPETGDTSFIDKLYALKIDNKQDSVSVQTRPAPIMNGARQLSPQKPPVARVPASVSPRTVSSVCFQCKQPGHFKDTCPQTRCYRCSENGHYGKNCPKFPSTPEKKRL